MGAEPCLANTGADLAHNISPISPARRLTAPAVGTGDMLLTSNSFTGLPKTRLPVM